MAQATNLVPSVGFRPCRSKRFNHEDTKNTKLCTKENQTHNTTRLNPCMNRIGDPLRVHNLFVHNFVFFVSSWLNLFLTQGKPIRYGAIEYPSAPGPATTIPRLFFFEKKKQKTFTLLGRALSD
jgi:hypothetical protein